ncbi:MAG: hypothetical protein M3R27_00175 [Bacteroidota bacterium]|nr:hypothetical protein [Bacteroidota bacterium]
MKNYILLSAITIMFSSMSCKSKKESQQNTVTAPVVGATTGKVSHMYRKDGCATIIMLAPSADESPMVLIPKDKLPAKLDVDGMEISFNYTPLKMPQPAGCANGIPADIKDAAKK